MYLFLWSMTPLYGISSPVWFDICQCNNYAVVWWELRCSILYGSSLSNFLLGARIIMHNKLYNSKLIVCSTHWTKKKKSPIYNEGWIVLIIGCFKFKTWKFVMGIKLKIFISISNIVGKTSQQLIIRFLDQFISHENIPCLPIYAEVTTSVHIKGAMSKSKSNAFLKTKILWWPHMKEFIAILPRILMKPLSRY